MNEILWLVLGGSIGTLARHAVSVFASEKMGPAFAYRSFFVNASGCFLMGFFASRLAGRETEKLFLLTGFCGAYTTFSTFEMETFRAVTEGAWLVGGLNVVGSVAAGYAALWLGVILSRAL